MDYLVQRLAHHLPLEWQKPPFHPTEMAALLTIGRTVSAAEWQALPDAVAHSTVLALKDDADQRIFHAWQDVLDRADQIMAIGTARSELAILALGTLVKADAIKIKTGRLHEAWALFDEAGALYRRADIPAKQQEIGWARTRIGRVFICAEVGQRQMGFAEAEQAREILERYEVWDRLFFLHYGWGTVCNNLFEFHESVVHFTHCLTIATYLGAERTRHEQIVYNNLAVAQRGLGRTTEALGYFRQAESWFEAQGATAALATVRFNQALIYMERGQYYRALQILYQVEPLLAEKYPGIWLIVVRSTMECSILLNRPHEAYTQGKTVLSQSSAPLTDFQKANFELMVAQAALACGFMEESDHYFESAATQFQAQGAPSLAARAALAQGQAALQRGDVAAALAHGEELTRYWRETESDYYLVDGLLLMARAHQQQEAWTEVRHHAREAGRLARQVGGVTLQYQAHLLLGAAEETSGTHHRARRHYRAGLAALERAQRGLTLTLRPDFFTNREAGLHHALRLELRQGDGVAALELLERWKDGAFVAHLQRRSHWQWQRTPDTAPLMDELAEVRARHFEQNRQRSTVAPQDSDNTISNLEQRMRVLTDALYMLTAQEEGGRRLTPAVRDLQAALPPNAALLEYYDDGERLWLLVLTAEGVALHEISLSSAAVRRLVTAIHENQQTTVQSYLPHDPWALIQAKKVRQDYAALGAALFAPIVAQLQQWERLYIVPYGVLHTLPFNLVRVQDAYLIEQVEVVMLPAAALLTQKVATGRTGTQWVGYSKKGMLPLAVSEATHLQSRWGGTLATDSAATRLALPNEAGQLLHLATHGVHRVDHHFDLSFLELADGALYGDDLLQLSLGYDLVTLSACDAGAAQAAPGGDLIGLGRAFLYAGAGAVVASLWQVRDDSTMRLMDCFYEQLFSGQSKATALRHAQRQALAENQRGHPVYWGAFQLVGNAATVTV